MAEHIVLCGKGGVGISSLSANISAALADAGFSVMLFGYNPRADSCRILNSGCSMPTVIGQLRKGGDIAVETVVVNGFRGVTCMELGDPSGGDNSVTEEIDRALRATVHAGIFEAISSDFVLHDLSGENARAVLQAIRHHVPVIAAFVVTTADFGSLSSANALFMSLTASCAGVSAITLGGLIPNGIGNSFEESFVRDFARTTRVGTTTCIPRSLVVKQSELCGKTVIEAAPRSNQSYFYRRVANQIVDEASPTSRKDGAKPMTTEQVREWGKLWANRLDALENGLVSDGAAI